MYGWDERRAILGFVTEGHQVRFVVPLPDSDDVEFHRTPTGRPVGDAVAPRLKEAYDSGLTPALLPHFPKAIATGENPTHNNHQTSEDEEHER
jgi:hypothetical protein